MTTAERLLNLFDGLRTAYGTYEIQGDPGARGKRTGKALTKQGLVDAELWQRHLYGAGIGIVPIRENSTCVFGAIDIDGKDSNYTNFDASATAVRVVLMGLPLVPCQSKSGGLHLYLFCAAPVPAALMQDRLREMANALGLPPKTEIFPKQREFNESRGDTGNWINVPYAGALSVAGTTRHAFDADGKPLSVEEFLTRAESTRQDPAFFSAPITIERPVDERFPDGPPCLQKLVQIGIGEGSRNNGLLNVALYYKRAMPDEWKDRVREAGKSAMFDPPLDDDEIKAVISSAARHSSYRYTCKKEPIQSVCDGAICRMRKYGVTRVGKKQDEDDEEAAPNWPVLGQLKMHKSEPVMWYLEVNNKEVRLTTAQLMTPKLFQLALAEQMRLSVPLPTATSWQGMTADLMKRAVEVEIPEDSTTSGIFWGHLAQYCTRGQATSKDGMINGMRSLTERGRTWFRVGDLIAFLNRRHFNITSAEIVAILKSKEAVHEMWNIRGVEYGVWGVPEFEKPADKPVTATDEVLF